MSRWSLELLSNEGRDREQWRECVTAIPVDKQDVYSLPEYAALYEGVYREPSFLLRYGDDWDQVSMVVVKRNLSELPFYPFKSQLTGLANCDISTPYGYGGPVINSSDKSNEIDLFAGFREALHEYCKTNGIVAEFLRLHPLMQNHQLFGEDPGLLEKNATVWIDLRPDEQEIHAGIRKEHRRNIRIAADKGVEIIHSDLRLAHLKEFHRLYTSRMTTLDAMSIFFLPLEFFSELVDTMRNHVDLFLAKWEGKIVSAYMFLRRGPFIHNFLSGSDSDHWDLRSNVLTVYKVALWAKGLGCQFFHLGGGHAVEMDGVFRFKSQFSPNRSAYYMYRKIHDEKAYEQLCLMSQEHKEQNPVPRPTKANQDPLLAGYFPAYRG